MKKVVLLSPAYPLRGGIANFTERLAREFNTMVFEVTIYTFSLQYPAFLFPGKTQLSTDPPPDDLNIKVVINSINPLNWLKVGRELRRLKPDWLIVMYWLPFMGPCLGTIARLVKRNRFTKTISIVHNLIPHEKRVGDLVFTKYFLKPIDGLVVLSQSVLKQVQALTDKPVLRTVHPIYDNFGEAVAREEALQQLELDAAKQYLLFFGFIRDYKGLDLLLEAMADERIQAMNLRLLVAGEFYGNEAHYNELIEKLGIQDQLVLRNAFIPSEAVKYYFGAADLVVQPYRRATQSGISQIAYHFEKPMVVTDVGGLSEIVGHGAAGYVVDVSPRAIADAIIDFYTSNTSARLIEGLRQNKARFSWRNLVTTIEAVEREL